MVVSIECQTFEGIFTGCKALLTDVIPLFPRKKLPTTSYAITHSSRNFRCKNFYLGQLYRLLRFPQHMTKVWQLYLCQLRSVHSFNSLGNNINLRGINVTIKHLQILVVSRHSDQGIGSTSPTVTRDCFSLPKRLDQLWNPIGLLTSWYLGPYPRR